jgi:hypothetical protein
MKKKKMACFFNNIRYLGPAASSSMKAPMNRKTILRFFVKLSDVYIA